MAYSCDFGVGLVGEEIGSGCVVRVGVRVDEPADRKRGEVADCPLKLVASSRRCVDDNDASG